MYDKNTGMKNIGVKTVFKKGNKPHPKPMGMIIGCGYSY